MESYPEDRSRSDYTHAVMTGAAGGIPVLGGLLAEIIALTWTPALVRRRDTWLRELGERLEELAEVVVGLHERIQHSEEVLTITLQAAQAATATHEQDVRRALKAAVVNTVLEIEPAEELRRVFIRLLSECQESHLSLLYFLDDPERWSDERELLKLQVMAGAPMQRVRQCLGWDDDFIDVIVADLSRWNLANPPLRVTMTGQGVRAGLRTTDFGKRFLRFITDQGPTASM